MSDKERIGPSPQRGLPQYNIDVRRDGPAVDTAGVIEVRGEVEQCDLSAGGGDAAAQPLGKYLCWSIPQMCGGLAMP